MAVPDDVLAVPRPSGSRVYSYGKNNDKYGVKKVLGSKRIGDRVIPIYGETIGHIVNLEYIPIDTETKPKVQYSSVDIKDWANVKLCDDVFKDILGELCAVYDYSTAMKIYCIAILRVCNPGIKNSELKEAYDTSFLSEMYTSVGLSKNTVGDLLDHLGKAYSRIVMFMRNRVGKIGIDHHLIVDGTLKTDDSKVDSLSEFSRKARVKGQREMSIIYLFDLDEMEPICSKCYPGNMLDLTAYKDFVRENQIKSGIIVADKGFPASAIATELESCPQLHTLNPVKRNSKLTETHNMTDYTGVLDGYPGVTYKKEKCVGADKWIYSFRDVESAYKEEKGWLSSIGKDNPYDNEALLNERLKFGTIVLESDLDLDPKVIYKAYSSRWEIELVMRYYKSACEFTDTRVHDDYSVIGSEFCDFLSSVLTYRLIGAFDRAGLLEKKKYKEILHVLNRAKKVRASSSGDWQLIQINPSQEEMLISLGLIEAPVIEKRKPGRPRKNSV